MATSSTLKQNPAFSRHAAAQQKEYVSCPRLKLDIKHKQQCCTGHQGKSFKKEDVGLGLLSPPIFLLPGRYVMVET